MRTPRKRLWQVVCIACAALPLQATAQSQPSPGADMICSPNAGCIEGQVATKAGVRVSIAQSPNSTLPTSAILLPGSYSSDSLASTNGNNATLLQPFLTSSSNTQAYSGFSSSLATSSTANTLSVSQGQGLVIYSSSLFSGSSSLLTYNDSVIVNATSSFTPLSYIMSDDIFLVANLPVSASSGASARIVLWDSVADTNELPLALVNGAWTIETLQSSKCSPGCASGGFCSLTGKCICAEGFTGDTCNACQAGRFGSHCEPCASCSNGTCDEGISGTGRCIPRPLTPAAEACNCVNGLCSFDKQTCACTPGWTDATGGSKCSVCEAGYYQGSDGECLACGSGCKTCTGPSGTCSSCQTGLQPSQDDSTKCIPQRFLPSNSTTFASCPSGTYLADASSQTCSPCNSGCAACFGAEANQCTSCPNGSGLLEGNCVSIDQTSGICDGSGVDASAALAWIANPLAGTCDPLPHGCLAGSIKNFTPNSGRNSIQCTRCLDGLVLSDGHCLTECPQGSFASSANGITTCSACASSCLSCEGSADFCSACPAGQLIVNGACISASVCPAGTFQSNTTAPCTLCHPDCRTCSTSFDHCDSCPDGRPALSTSNTCLLACASNEYLEASTGLCSRCDASCGTCSGPGSGKCLSCTGTTTLKAGACVPAKCDVMTPYGICLQDLAVIKARSTLEHAPEGKKSKKLPFWVYIVISLGILGLLIMLIVLWRMRNIRKRMNETQGFSLKRGLLGFLRLRRRNKDDEQNPDAKSNKASIHLHTTNNIEVQRSPTPPSYQAATTFIHPDLYKPPIVSADSASNYSFPRGPESHIWPNEKGKAKSFATRHERESTYSFDWPPVRPAPTAEAEASSSKNPFRPLLLRDSTSTGSRSSLGRLSDGAEKRFGTIDFTKDLELMERRKAFSKLTRGSETA